MNGLHLSDNYQPHDLNAEEFAQPFEEAPMSFNVNLSPQELEQKLKNANRITLCDQIRKTFREDNEIIPKVLLDRGEQPCRALILWRPPPPIEMLVTGFEPRALEDDESFEIDDNNNNDSNMDMDV